MSELSHMSFYEFRARDPEHDEFPLFTPESKESAEFIRKVEIYVAENDTDEFGFVLYLDQPKPVLNQIGGLAIKTIGFSAKAATFPARHAWKKLKP